MRVLALLLAATLAGCALLRPDVGEVLQVQDIVGASVRAANAAPDEQRRRLTQGQKAFAVAPSDENRLRLGALLATLPAPWRDDTQAAGLLEPLAARRPDSPFAELARMLAVSIAERQKLALEVRAAELRAQAAELRSQTANLRAEAAERREAASTERADTLHRQVEALKAIERSILEREERRRKSQR